MKRIILIIAATLLIACGGGNPDAAQNSEISSFLAPKARMAQLDFTPVTQDDLYQFFAIAFGAAPGVIYMGQLNEAVDAGMTIKEIVNVFTTKSQFTDFYPTSLSHTNFATKLVDNVVGSSATTQAKASAVNDVVSALSLPDWTRGDVIFAIFTNLAGKPSTDPDWAGTSRKMKNQVVYAKYYTEVMKGNATDVPTLQKVIGSVSETSDISIPAIELAINNSPPVANAGVAQNVIVGSVVTLDGSGSSDANSNPLSYAWMLTSKPVGSTAVLSSTTSAKPTFNADVTGTYVVTLTVNDGKVNSTAVMIWIIAESTNKFTAQVSPEIFDFGNVNIGSQSAEKLFQVRS